MATMGYSTFKRVTLAPLALASDQRVSSVATAPKHVPIRVLISNLSGAQTFFGCADQSMIGPDAPGNDVFEIAPGANFIFVLAPGQKLFGCANGAGAIISVAISEAFPGL